MTNQNQQSIRERAYTMWDADGRQAGRDIDYWLRAEQEVARPAPKSKSSAAKSPARKATKAAATAAKKPRAKSAPKGANGAKRARAKS